MLRSGDDWAIRAYDDSASKHRCAIVSSIPIKPIVLPDISNPSRYCAGLIESYCNGGIREIVVCNIYGPSGDEPAAGILIHELAHALNSLSHRWILIGDFNLVQEDRAVCQLLSAGLAYSLDDAGTVILNIAKLAMGFVPQIFTRWKSTMLRALAII